MKQINEQCNCFNVEENFTEFPLPLAINNDKILAQKYVNKIPSCGVYCGGCPQYLVSDNHCPGAEINYSGCNNCKPFHQCCVKREIAHCYECSLYPCSKFKTLAEKWKRYGQDLKLNQKLMEIKGEEYLLAYHYTNKV